MEAATHGCGLADRVLLKGRALLHDPLAPRVHPQRRSDGAQAGPYAAPHSAPPLAELWDRHARSVYSLACTLLGDEAAASRAVMLGVTDLARTGRLVSAEDALRLMARHVFWRSRELADETPRSRDLSPAMVWLGRLAHLQRASLALCVFGGHTHREAAGLLDVPPATVAELLTSGLRELGRMAADGAPVGEHASTGQ